MSADFPLVSPTQNAFGGFVDAFVARIADSTTGAAVNGLSQEFFVRSLTSSAGPAWQASADVPWLSMLPASGTGPSRVTATVNPAGLAPGRHTGHVTVTADAANSPQVLTVFLEVRSGLVVEPTTVELSGALDGSDSRFLSAPVAIREAAGTSGLLQWVAQATEPWLIPSPSSGVAPATLTATASLAGLEVGEYGGAILVTDTTTGQQRTVNVILRVHETRDPGTTASGTVWAPDNAPFAGAAVVCRGVSVASGPGGQFAIADVPTAAGTILCIARGSLPDGTPVAGASETVEAVPGGTTDVGRIDMAAPFAEEFASATLDSEWQVVAFTGTRVDGQHSSVFPANHYSLSEAPGSLRYTLDPRTYDTGLLDRYQVVTSEVTDLPHDFGLELQRSLRGGNWVLETRVTAPSVESVDVAVLPFSVYFGDGGPGTVDLTFRRVQFGEPGFLDMVLAGKWGAGSGERVTAAQSSAYGPCGEGGCEPLADTVHYRLEREGSRLAARWSTDGTSWQTAFCVEMGTRLDGLAQRVLLSGESGEQFTGAHADYDFVRFTPGAASIGAGCTPFSFDPIPPAVAIASPEDGVELPAGSPILLQAVVEDNDFSSGSVTFYADDQALFTDAVEPFEFAYTLPAVAGAVTFRAVAYDFDLNRGVSAPVTVQVVAGPAPAASTSPAPRLADLGGAGSSRLQCRILR
jgi:hypothetical protein